MDDQPFDNLVSTVQLISTNLDKRPDSWREQLQAVRNITRCLEILDTTPDPAKKEWQLSLISLFQRIAFTDADNGAIQDVADWCLRQLLILLHLYPEEATILALIGRNWLLRAQRPLANISRTERGSSSSSGASTSALWPEITGHQVATARAFAEAEERLHTADYVEARGILLPATEYLQRAVDATSAQGDTDGMLLATAAEAHMSLGNVTSSKVNDRYFNQAISYLRAAATIQAYSLPPHLEQYLEDHSSLYPHA